MRSICRLLLLLLLRVLIVRTVSSVLCRAIRVCVFCVHEPTDTGNILISLNTPFHELCYMAHPLIWSYCEVEEGQVDTSENPLNLCAFPRPTGDLCPLKSCLRHPLTPSHLCCPQTTDIFNPLY